MYIPLISWYPSSKAYTGVLTDRQAEAEVTSGPVSRKTETWNCTFNKLTENHSPDQESWWEADEDVWEGGQVYGTKGWGVIVGQEACTWVWGAWDRRMSHRGGGHEWAGEKKYPQEHLIIFSLKSCAPLSATFTFFLCIGLLWVKATRLTGIHLFMQPFFYSLTPQAVFFGHHIMFLDDNNLPSHCSCVSSL